ncbi:MAG: type II toxin-antitoxin system HipA family toxin [Chitinophagia bacterium]|jgi:serine/threonine-protein kinase HipA|nr:type II toxin-antitoxin system HipA family toxin [Chitinophagia bacterium]
MSKRCLYCYQLLVENETDFHSSCSKKIFGVTIPPVLPYSENNMEKLAAQVIQTQTVVTGVQPKLSLHLASAGQPNLAKRFTVVGMWGGYILKPASPNYPELPEVEDLTMHLASIAKIKVVPHSLMRLNSGNLAYITKRIDRKEKEKLQMEDMCQLTERLTEDKYLGSHEQVAKAILKYSANPGLDVVNFFELVLFSFLTGNADMHLKNFSLIHQTTIGPIFSPAYDLVATALVNPADDEDLALTLNGRKKKINRNDFISAFTTLGLDEKQQENIFKKMEKAKKSWIEFIDISFLSNDLKTGYKNLLQNRFERLHPTKNID